MTALKPPFTYFGGKTAIADRIVALLPDHKHYVEPFAGSLSVLLAKPPSPMETVNDLDGDLMNFWRVLRDRPAEFERVCALTPHSRAEYVLAYGPAADDLERARRPRSPGASSAPCSTPDGGCPSGRSRNRNHGRTVDMTTRRWAAAAFAIYVAAIVASNWLITHVGIPAGPGVHLTPVGFGLLAPSGVWAAAVSFPARDVTQRLGGRWLGIIAILTGAAVSWWISNPHIAVASGLTYLCSESADFAVYTPLQRRWFVPAVFASGCVAIVVDSVLFLHLAGLYSLASLEGLILGKFWVILAAVPVTWMLRNRGPVAAAPEVSPA